MDDSKKLIKIMCALRMEEVRKLSPEDQSEVIYACMRGAADMLGDLGFDPNIVAHVTRDVGFDLTELDGGPAQTFKP
jgi:hypothetical protein